MEIARVVRLVFGGSLLFLLSCATNFTGSPHVEGGRAGCEKKCKAQGMEVAGMVYMGEYSDACVCSVPGQTAGHHKKLVAAVAGAGAGAAGVVLQMRRSDDNNRAVMLH
ncbi:MAG: hypothetical protein HS104_40595 [Polyangiaceae bacterium]|nr:hypothetical protein [Polyangiaceae bacterium]MCE7892659.1 hypothetical protein [Sorangiineae bacterium PRO1]MCL4756382.1 hypothetical protein [Myxococcales bacterium]